MVLQYTAPRRRLPLPVAGFMGFALLAGACGTGTDSAATDALALNPPASVATGSDDVEAAVATTAIEVERPATLPAPVGEAAPAGGAAVEQPAPAGETASTSGGPTTTTAPAAAVPSTAAPSTAAPSTAAPTTAAPLTANNFPASAVQRISDRVQVNANDQLGGGDRPLLLWFWAPY